MKRKKIGWYENLPMIDKLPLWYKLEKNLNDLKVNIGIDKLKLCYRVVNDAVIKELEDNKPDFYSLYDCDLRRIEGKYHSDIYQILIPTYNKDNEMITVVFGELRFNLKAEINEVNVEVDKEKRVWLYVDNKILYSNGCEMFALEFIAENLGLRLRNITEMEIYIDSTKRNIPQLLKKMVRTKDYTIYLNGKKIKDREEYRPEFDYNHSGNCNRYTNLTFYASSQKALKNKIEGISICGYDKIVEINYKSKKYHILEKYNDSSKLYRIEIRVGNEKFKEFLNENKIELVEFLFRDKGFLYSAFEWFFEKVLYFKNENKEKITIANIVI